MLDLSHNRLEDPEIVEEVFAKMPSLVCTESLITFFLLNYIIVLLKDFLRFLIKTFLIILVIMQTL